MTELKRPEIYVHFESIKPELKEVTEFYTRKAKDYQHCLKQLNEYADALENEISILKGNSKIVQERDPHAFSEIEVLLDNTDKQLVVVPQFVAEWFEINKVMLDINIYILINRLESKGSLSEFDIWFINSSNNPMTTLVRMQDGYTVEKEKLFYLKSKMTGRYLRSYTGLGMDDTTLRYEEVDDRRACGFGGGTTFTQFEIDEMETGSYEKIEVVE